jgi:Ni,Fe-hydrogenase III component G
VVVGIRISNLIIIAVLPVPAPFSGRDRVNVLVEQELGEDMELVLQELKREVHRSVHNTNPMLTNRICYRVNANRIRHLRSFLRSPLDEELLVQVVAILCDKNIDIAHDLQHIETLIQRPHWQMPVRELEPKHLHRKTPHLAVRLPVVERHRRQVEECPVQVVLDTL